MTFHRRFYAFGTVLLLAALTGCASAKATPGAEAERSAHIAVPLVLQDAPTYCGIAALDMLTAYYEVPLAPDSEKGLKDEATETGGVSGKSMRLALEDAGYDVYIFPGTLGGGASSLYRELSLGRPVIVMTGDGPRHYCVVSGYDESSARISVLDPASGADNVRTDDFTHAWRAANYFCLLAIPRPGVRGR